MSFLSCGTKPLGKNPSTIEENICEVEKEIDSFYLTKCGWAELLTEDKTENYLFSLQEVKDALADCHARHNPLVDILVK